MEDSNTLSHIKQTKNRAAKKKNKTKTETKKRGMEKKKKITHIHTHIRTACTEEKVEYVFISLPPADFTYKL